MTEEVAERPAHQRALLEVEGLHASYGGVRALRGVSLTVPQKGIVAVLGNNGAGKSTLLRALSGVLGLMGGHVDQGTMRFEGSDLVGKDPADIVRLGITQAPEGRRVFAHLTVDENLRAGALSVRDRDVKARAREHVMELFPRLEERLEQKAGLLSGGEQQMLAIGRALMGNPELLLLDEPSLGLAPQIVEMIGETIKTISELGAAVILVEQNAAMALSIADHAYVLEVGAVTLDGPAKELAESDEVKARYLGIGDKAEITPHKLEPTGRGTPSRRDPHELTVKGATVQFGGLKALDDVSLTVAAGTTHAVIGPNGAGKSTLMNLLTGVYRASAGTVSYGDTSLIGLRPPKIAGLGVSRTFQNIALSPHMTVRDNLRLGRHRLTKTGFVAAGLNLPSARNEEDAQTETIDRIAELLHLTDKCDQIVASLSYGDLKRVEIGRALASEPSLLLLDEPVAGMNADEKQDMADAIGRLREALGLSLLIVEHDMRFVMGLAERITVLDFGRMIADGTPEEVQHDPDVLAAYLGTKSKDAA